MACEREVNHLFKFDNNGEHTNVFSKWPIPDDTEQIILDFVQKKRLEALESQFDTLSRTVAELKEKYQSGRRYDMSSNDKRQLAKQIGNGNRKRSAVLKEMVPHILYLQNRQHLYFLIRLPSQMEQFSVWSNAAMNGTPFWISEQNEDEDRKKKAKGKAVEIFLKINRALEHITTVIPRELKDAHFFFSKIEEDLKEHVLPLGQYMHEVGLEDLANSNNCSEFHQFCSGLHVIGADTLVNATRNRVDLEELAEMLTLRFSQPDGDLYQTIASALQGVMFQIAPNSFSSPSFAPLSHNYTRMDYVKPHVPEAKNTKNWCRIVSLGQTGG